MLARLAQKIFGSKNERELKRMRPLVEEIGQLEPELQPLGMDELRAENGYLPQPNPRGHCSDTNTVG